MVNIEDGFCGSVVFFAILHIRDLILKSIESIDKRQKITYYSVMAIFHIFSRFYAFFVILILFYAFVFLCKHFLSVLILAHLSRWVRIFFAYK